MNYSIKPKQTIEQSLQKIGSAKDHRDSPAGTPTSCISADLSPPRERYYTRAEAAAMCRVSKKTIAKAVYDKLLREIEHNKKVKRIAESDLIEYLEKKRGK